MGIARMAFPHEFDAWFAWYPVRLSTKGNVMGEPEEGGKFWVPTKKWAWLRRVGRWRGLYLGTSVHVELTKPHGDNGNG